MSTYNPKIDLVFRKLFGSEQEREIYDAELKARLDDLEELRTAEERGRKEGEVIGMEKGRTEALRETVLNLLRKGIPADMIAQATGMTLDEITALGKNGKSE